MEEYPREYGQDAYLRYDIQRISSLLTFDNCCEIEQQKKRRIDRRRAYWLVFLYSPKARHNRMLIAFVTWMAIILLCI